MALIGEVLHHTFCIFIGDGRNGKDTVLETLMKVTGDMTGIIAPELLLESGREKSADAPSPAIMSLMGKRMVWGSEANQEVRLNPSQVKRLTGGNTLVGRHPYGRNNISFTPSHTLILVTNDMPKASAVDYAFWKRTYVINFPLRFVENPNPHVENERLYDPNIKDKLLEDPSEILSWLVRGCIEYQQHGLNPPESVMKLTERYRQDADDILVFVSNEYSRRDGGEVLLMDIHEHYTMWCRREGIKHSLGKNTFRKRMERLGYQTTRDNYKRRVFSDLCRGSPQEEYVDEEFVDDGEEDDHNDGV